MMAQIKDEQENKVEPLRQTLLKEEKEASEVASRANKLRV
jgi:hypothetical protein